MLSAHARNLRRKTVRRYVQFHRVTPVAVERVEDSHGGAEGSKRFDLAMYESRFNGKIIVAMLVIVALFEEGGREIRR